MQVKRPALACNRNDAASIENVIFDSTAATVRRVRVADACSTISATTSATPTVRTATVSFCPKSIRGGRVTTCAQDALVRGGSGRGGSASASATSDSSRTRRVHRRGQQRRGRFQIDTSPEFDDHRVVHVSRHARVESLLKLTVASRSFHDAHSTCEPS